MSLMFAALRTLEGERAAVAAPANATRRLAVAAWPALLWLGAGAALGGSVFWLAFARPATPAPRAEAPMLLMAPVAAQVETTLLATRGPAPAVSAPASVPTPDATPVAGATPVIAVATAPVPANTDAPAQAGSAPATPAPAVVAPAPRGFAPLPPGSLVVRDAAAPAAHAAPRDADDPDPAAVASHVEAMGNAIESGDFTAAQNELQSLQHLLPAQSLTLLRMRAWLAQRRGDTAQALPLYREIVARMPGDRGAAINLALLEAGNGQLDDARQRLRVLKAGEAEASENERQALARAVAEVGGAP